MDDPPDFRRFQAVARILYSAFFAALRKLGAVVIVSLFLSISAAHNAAPTVDNQHYAVRLAHRHYSPVLVKLNKIEATGISSKRVATVPKLPSD